MAHRHFTQTPTWLVVHHSASPLTTSLEDIRTWHKARGWRDVGYHYVVEADGEVRVGRPLPEIGAHAYRFNRESIGICLVGDNTSPDQGWKSAQVSSLVSQIDALERVFPGITVCGHRDLVNTQCPGLDVRGVLGMSPIPQIRRT